MDYIFLMEVRREKFFQIEKEVQAVAQDMFKSSELFDGNM